MKLKEILRGLAVIIIISIGLFLVWTITPKLWHWHVKNWQSFNSTMAGRGSFYCSDLKKIIKAEPIFEDNGKYEDESYRVTYEDNSVGLIDQGVMESGYYCVSKTYIKDTETPPENWVLEP